MLSLSFSFFSQCSDTDNEKGILIAKIKQLYVHHAQFNIDVKNKAYFEVSRYKLFQFQIWISINHQSFVTCSMQTSEIL